VQQHQGFARAPFNVVEPNATYIEEATGCRIVTLSFLCKMTIVTRAIAASAPIATAEATA
jgi:hypothetical protein